MTDVVWRGPAPWLGLVLLYLMGIPSLHAQDRDDLYDGLDVKEYRISVRVEEGTGTVTGETRVRFRRARGTDTLRLAMDALRITGLATEDGHTLPFDTTGGRELRIAFPHAELAEDTQVVIVRYSCRPRRGMTILGPDASHPQRPREIWTQGQPDHNPAWFPCRNDPRDKARSELWVRVDTALTVYGNGLLQETREHGDGTRSWGYRLDLPHSDYLIAFVAGTFRELRDSVRGIPIRSLYPPHWPASRARRLFDRTPAMLRFFLDAFAISWPWPGYTQVPIANFPHGGMENTTLTTLSDERVFVPPPMLEEYPLDPLLAHELAHHWWGDLVTSADRTHLWLNEGFATYMQQRWTRHDRGEQDYAVQRLLGIEQVRAYADGGGRIPVLAPDPMIPVNAYTRGAAVLHMLARIAGEEKFRTLVRRWTERYAFDAVTTEDLVRLSEDVLGRPMRWFFDQWLRRPSAPQLTVRWTWTRAIGLRIEIRQSRPADSLGTWFRLPLRVDIGGKEGRDVEVRDSLTVLTLPKTARPAWVRVDPEGDLCGRIDHVEDVATTRRVMERHPSFLARLRAMEVLCGHRGDPAVWSALLRAYRRERHREFRTRLLRRLGDEAEPRARSLFVAALGDRAAAVRAYGVIGLSRLRTTRDIPHFRAALSDSSDNVATAALNGLLMVDSTTTGPDVRGALLRPSWKDQISRAALEWIRRYGMPLGDDTLRRLGAPGRDLDLRALASVMRLERNPREALPWIRGVCGEPDPEVRILGILLLVRLGTPAAREELRAVEERESDPRVWEVIRNLRRSSHPRGIEERNRD